MFIKKINLTILCLFSLVLSTREIPAKLAIFPLAFYSPETSVAFGTAMTLNSAKVPLNNLAGIVFFTLKGQYQINTNGAISWADNRWRLEGDLGFSRYPNRLYSIGPDSEAEYGEYTQHRLTARLTVQMRAGSWFLGPLVNFARYSSVDVEPGTNQTPNAWPGFEKASILGLGISLIQDRRDHPFDPRGGHYTRLQFIPYLGVNEAFSRFIELKIDHRRYLRLTDRLTWAVAGNLQAATGKAPFHVLPSYGDQGGSFRVMRGFYGNRYRDRVLLSLQNELRFLLSDRWCAQLFVDAGQVSPAISSLSLKKTDITLGIGIGFIVDKASRLPIHFEAGFSKEGRTFSFKPMAAF